MPITGVTGDKNLVITWINMINCSEAFSGGDKFLNVLKHHIVQSLLPITDQAADVTL